MEPLDDKWKVSVVNLKTQEEKTLIFDVVMVCNGHYHTPRIPKIPGCDTYKGKQIHSHDFRDIHDFRDKSVLAIGAGPSGMDIALQIASTANQVIYYYLFVSPSRCLT